jgi:hypothetical protein
MAETLIQMLPFLSQNENVNIRRLTEEILTNLGLPSRILIPEEDILAAKEEAMAQQQMMMQAEQQAKLGGAAAGEPALQAQEQLEQELMAMDPDDAAAALAQAGVQVPEGQQPAEESLVGGGGAPIRGQA